MAGWMVLGVFCAAALILMLIGAFHVLRAQRELNDRLERLEEAQRRILQPERLQAALARISRDAESVNDLMQRARGAVSTISVAIRYVAVAARLVKLLS